MRANADALADELQAGGLDVLTGGTDTHLLQRRPARAPTGRARTPRSGSHEVAITVNRNTVPFDERPPTVASGVRLGTPAATMRGFDEDDFREVGADHRAARSPTTPTSPRSRARSRALCERRPLYPGFRGYTTYVA